MAYEFIAQGVAPPQVETPTQAAGHMLQLRSLAQQGQMQDLALQQQRQDFQDQQTMRQAYMESGGDMDKFQQLLMQRGASSKAIQDAAMQRLTMRETLAKLNDQELKNTAARHDQLRGQIGAFESQPDPVKQQQYLPTLKQWAQNGLLTPEEYSQALQAHAQYPGAEMMQMYANGLRSGTQAAEEVIKDRTAKAAEVRANATATQAQTGQTRLNAELPGIQADQQNKARVSAATQLGAAKTPEEYQSILATLPYGVAKMFEGKTAQQAQQLGMTPDQQVTTAGQAESRQQTAAHNKVIESQGAQRIAIERQNAVRQQKQFDVTYGAMLDGNGQPLAPEAAKAVAMQDPMAVAIANYQLPPPAAGRSGPGAGVLRKVMAINPSYNAQNWQAQAQMMRNFTSGSTSKEISGINTALGHVATLGEAIDALHNNNVQVLNRIGNAYNVQTGGDAVTTFNAIVHKVAPELNRAYVGGVGSQGEIKTQESDFDPKLGDRQLRSNVAITTKLLRSKIGSLENQWKTTMGSDFGARFIMPEAKAAVEKWAPEGGGNAGAKASFKVGDRVMYNGAQHTITAVKPDGKLVLDGNQ